MVRSCLDPEPDRRPTAADVAEALVPGAGDGRIDPPPLSKEARALVAEHATMPATRHYETLAHTLSTVSRFPTPRGHVIPQVVAVAAVGPRR